MFICLDIETTGISPEEDKIIEIAAIKFEGLSIPAGRTGIAGGKILTEYHILINPEIPLPEEVKRLTGLADSDLIDAPKIFEIASGLKMFLGDAPIIGHNINFDIDFLRQNSVQIQNPAYDTLVLARILLPSETSYALDILADKLQLKNKPSHRALTDVHTTMELFNFLQQKISALRKPIKDKLKILFSGMDWKYKNLFLQGINSCSS